MTEPLLALADDLTGACELAGVALQRGVPARVTTDLTADWPRPGELLVVDTETRLSRPVDAKRRLVQWCERCADRPVGLLYKKTDSVLRGPVVAELESVALTLGYERILLVPGNPALGRTITGGRVAINGQPLSQTIFARDPHHPAVSDDVLQLLGTSPLFRSRVAEPGGELPEGTLTVGDTTSAADLGHWALQADTMTLTAGGAAWFDALLAQKGFGATSTPPIAPPPAGPWLLLSGTTANRAQVPDAGMAIAWLSSEDTSRSAVADWLQHIEQQLRRQGRAAAAVTGAIVPDASSRLGAALAAAALRAVRHHAVSHLIIEGGATAAAILRTLECPTLLARHVWAPGVVTLESIAGTPRWFTVKPGSYPFPEHLHHWLRGATPRTPA